MGMTPKPFYDSIFWVEVDKIRPNPFQPRRDFHEAQLRELAESVRQYGILQPLVVTRKEIESPDGSVRVEYELIAGERRWRAAKMAGLSLVPVVIRSHEESDKMKLELAIIENLQRVDLNPVERALAFKQLQEYGYNNAEIARKIGRSREYVANTLRILKLPENMLEALKSGVISEGMSRPLLMLEEYPEEQQALFREAVEHHLSVREAERIARRIATERTRKRQAPEVREVESLLGRALGTRVMVTPRSKGEGGRIVITYYSDEELRALLATLAQRTTHDMPSHNSVDAEAPQEPQSAPTTEAGVEVSPTQQDAPPSPLTHDAHQAATTLPPQDHTDPSSLTPTPPPVPLRDQQASFEGDTREKHTPAPPMPQSLASPSPHHAFMQSSPHAPSDSITSRAEEGARPHTSSSPSEAPAAGISAPSAPGDADTRYPYPSREEEKPHQYPPALPAPQPAQPPSSDGDDDEDLYAVRTFTV